MSIQTCSSIFLQNKKMHLLAVELEGIEKTSEYIEDLVDYMISGAAGSGIEN